MQIPEAVNLITVAYTINDYGVQQKAETSKTVYGYVGSVSAPEIFEGGRNGLNPELRLVMTELDYSGQTVLERGGLRYAVYRSYRPGNGTIELYCERKGGTNGAPGNH